MSSQNSQQLRDENGFITVERNPISRVGVFPYYGRNISEECEPDRIYNVLRPAEELADPEAMKSFELIPLVDDHTMLGGSFTPAEEKGVQGTTGERLAFEDGILYAPLKIFSETLKRLIAKGKKELSLGYRVGQWEKKSGIFNGQAYEFIQRQLRGNHIALVDQGRMGPAIAVLDHAYACDAFDLNITDKMISENVSASKTESQSDAAEDNKATDSTDKKGANDMAEEKVEEKKGASLDDMHKFMKDNLPMLKKIGDMLEEHSKKDGETEVEGNKAEDADTKEKTGEQEDAAEEKEDKAKDSAEEKEKAKDASEEKKDKEAMDSINKRLAAMDSMEKRLAAVEGRGTKEILADLSNRDKLVAKVTPHIGTFDHSLMAGADEVASYALEKLGKKAAKGTESVVLDAYLDGLNAAKPRIGFAIDSKKSTSGSDLLAKTLADSK